MITRQTFDGTVINPEQRISREQALRMWTTNGAYLSFEEKIKGSIEPGKLADLVVITKDFLSCPVDEIKEIEALATMPSKEEIYSKLLYLLNAPAQRLVTAMNAVGRNLAVVIDQGVKENKFKEA